MDQKLVAELTANVRPLMKELANAVKILAKSTDQMAASMKAFADANQRSIQKAADDFDKLSTQGQIMAAKLARAQAEAAAAIAKSKEAESKQVIAAENAKLAAQKAVVAAEAQLEKQRRAESDATARALKANADRLKKSNQELIRQATAALKQATREGAPNTYQNLAYQTALLSKELKNLPGAFDLATGAINKNNAAAVTLQQQINQNNTALKNADALMNQHQRNVGNYGSALGGLRGNLLTLGTALFGVSTAFEAIRAVLGVFSTMERQAMAMRNASTSAAQFGANMQLAAKLAMETGAPLSDTTDALRKFTGATRGTAIEGEKARQIFSAFSKTFTANGASTEELSRATKALSDMMSKGTIQAEELKGQLGDAMPGAVKIFADAMGVSQRELLKMMANGELLAEDVLPKVAAMLEKTGEKAKLNLNTMSGSFDRATSSFKIFLNSFNDDSAVTRFFSKITNSFSELFIQMSRVNSEMKKADVKQAGLFAWFEGTTSDKQSTHVLRQMQEIARVQKELASLRSKSTGSGLDLQNIRLAEIRLNSLKNGLVELQRIQSKQQGVQALNAKKGSPDNTVANIRAEIDKIPARAIGENGKADLTKQETKNLREMRDEVVNLFNTLKQSDVERLKLKSLKDELTSLLSGAKKAGGGRGAGVGPQRLYDLDKFSKILADIRGESDRLDTESGNKLLLENLKDRAKVEAQIAEIRKLNVSQAAKDQAIAEANELLQKRIADRIEEQNKKLLIRSKAKLQVFGDTPDAITGKIDNKNLFTNSLNNALSGLRSFQKQMESVNEDFNDFMSGLGPMADSIAAIYGSKIQEINGFNQVLLIGFAEIMPSFTDSLGGALDALLQFKDSGKSIFKQFGQAVLDTLRQVISKLIATVVIAELLNLALGGLGIASKAGVAYGGGAGFKTLTKGLGLPMFAEGGVVNKATLGVFGEAGPEAVIPLDKLNGMLATAASGGGGQGYIAETRIDMNSLVIGLKRAERKMN